MLSLCFSFATGVEIHFVQLTVMQKLTAVHMTTKVKEEK